MRVTISSVIATLAVLAACGDDAGTGETSGATGSSSADDGGPTSAGPTTAGETSTGGTATTDGPADTTAAESGSSSGELPGTSTGEPPGTTTGEPTGSESSTGAAACRVVLLQAVVDAVGADDMLQWVQLHNSCDVEIDLSSYAIGYGGDDYGPPRVKALVGSIGAGGCYTVGGPSSTAANGSPDFEYADDFAPGLVLAGKVGAGIALFDVPAAMVDAATVPIDAVVYGANNDAGLIDESGQPVAAPHVAAPAEGEAIRRTSLDATWEVVAVPTPGDCPGF